MCVVTFQQNCIDLKQLNFTLKIQLKKHQNKKEVKANIAKKEIHNISYHKFYN